MIKKNTKNLNTIQKVLSEHFFVFLKKMTKAKLPKIFKVKKEKERPQILVVRHKNLSKQQLKEFKADLDEYCQAYFSEPKDE